MPTPPDDRQRLLSTLDSISRILERVLQVILAIVSVAVFAGAVWIMLIMDASSRSQGGRVYVAIGAIVALAAVEGKLEWLASRRRPFWMSGPGESKYRRNLLLRIALYLLAAVVLMGLALRLP